MIKRAVIGGTFAAGMLAGAVFLTSANAERCALVVSGNLDHLRSFESACPPDPAGKPQYKWLPAAPVAPPSYDPDAEVLEGPFYAIGASSVTESWSVRSKTAQEIDDSHAGKISNIRRAVFLALCKHENDIRALQTPPLPALNNAQCFTGLKNLLP